MITFNSFGESDPSGTGTGTPLFSFNNVGGNFLFASVMFDSLAESVSGSSVFYNGVALTELYANKLTATGLWVGCLSNPAKGTHNFAVNFSGSVNIFRTGISTFAGVDLVTPLGGSNSATATDSGTTLATTVTVTGASGMIVDAFSMTPSASGNVQAPETQIMGNTGTWSGGVQHLGGMAYEPHTGSNITVTWENLGAGNKRRLLFAQELLPAPIPPFTPQVLFI